MAIEETTETDETDIACPFTPAEVEQVASGVLSAVFARTLVGLTDHLREEFYDGLGTYLYEHYDNHRQEIDKQLLRAISGEFSRCPADSKFDRIRLRMFNDNREALLPILTDDAVEAGLGRVLQSWLREDQYFDWQWEDALARWVLAHADLFCENTRIQAEWDHRALGLASQ